MHVEEEELAKEQERWDRVGRGLPGELSVSEAKGGSPGQERCLLIRFKREKGEEASVTFNHSRVIEISGGTVALKG